MPNNSRKGLTRKLRENMTDAEARFWYLLRDRRLSGFKFRRQFPIGSYVVDFYCHQHRLIVELDGGQHSDNPKDVARTRWLEEQGYSVLRFWNDQVLKEQEAVLQVILDVLSSAPSSGAARHLLPEGEGTAHEISK